MKPLLCALTVLLGAMIASNSYAAPKGDNGGPLMRGIDVISTALQSVADLTDAQKQQTKAVLADAEAQLVAVRDEIKAKGGKTADKTDKQAARQKAQEIILNARSQVEAQLTAEQKKTFRDALRKAREEAAPKDRDKRKGEKGDPTTRPNV